MPRPKPLPIPLADGPFIVRDAIALGVNPGALRRSTLRFLPADAVLSHVTALRLRGIEVPRSLERDQLLHVIVRAPGQRAQRAGIVTHVSGRADLASTGVAGLAVTSPAQTWMLLARELDADELVVLGDAMLRRKTAVTTEAALAKVTAASSGVRGAKVARSVLTLVRAGTDSSLETRARPMIVRAGLPCPRVNEPVRDAWGRFVALPDPSYPELKVAIEYDADIHRTDARTWRRGIARR